MTWKHDRDANRPRGLLTAFAVGIVLGGAFGAWTTFESGVERGLFATDKTTEMRSPAMQEPDIQRINQIIDCSFN
ncbi:MAG TPA: hypothetical protein VKS22_01775 [Candidatus Binataceae bacterium]|nr:hypothetical protein [Candidatus Binataceae bacterium]